MPMPKRAIEIPAELETVADLMLDQGMLMSKAKDLFGYALLTRAKNRDGGDLLQAARKMGMTKQQFEQNLHRMEVRLSA